MMARDQRMRANAVGRYYVTSGCNACGLCAYCAPDSFDRSWDGTYFAVRHQPLTPPEEEAVQAALFACPLQCIRDDGDPA